MRASLVPVFAALAMAAAAGCENKPAAGSDAGAPAPAPDAGDASSPFAHVSPLSTARPPPGCHPLTAGGHVLPKLTPGALSIAAANGGALVVDSVYEGPTPASKADAVGTSRAHRVMLDATGAPAAEPQPIGDALPPGDGILTFAAATQLSGALTTLAYASRRPSPRECADGVLVASAEGRPRRELGAHGCRWTSLMRGAARADLGVVFLEGPTPAEWDAQKPVAVADVFVLDALETVRVRVHGGGKEKNAPPAPTKDAGAQPAGATMVDTPAVAAGATSVAAAWVVARGTVRDLHVVRLGRKGERTGAVELLDTQNVGTATLAFDGDTLHVVWSSFVPERNRYVLRWTKWPAGGAPAPPQSIGTGVLSAFAPSLAIADGRYMLAWAEGDAKSAIVKAGATRPGVSGVAPIPGVADVVSSSGANARDPVVAIDKDALFVAWKELGADARSGSVRAAAVKCWE